MEYNEVIRNKIKEDLYKMLLEAGESPTRLEKENYILSNGIKFSRVRNNSKYIYQAEETIADNYASIDNILLLTLLKLYFVKVCDNIKTRGNKEGDLISSLTFKDVLKELEDYENRNKESGSS